MAGASASTSKQEPAKRASNGNASGPRRRVSCRSVPGGRASSSSTPQSNCGPNVASRQGVEETTVEEIVQAAGVTKGTFYFHFAHKEDILLEVGWGTSEALFKDATKLLAADRSDRRRARRAARVARAQHLRHPAAAVARTIAEFYRRPDQGRELAGEHFGFQRSFAVVFFHTQETGQLPSFTDARNLGEMLSSLTMGAIHVWISDPETDLASALRVHAELLLAGVREVNATGPPDCAPPE